MANGTQPMNETNDIPPPKAPPDRAIIVTIVTAIGGLAVGLVAIAIAIVAPLHGSLDSLRSDMREGRAEARADAFRIEERLNAIENRLAAAMPHPPTLPLPPADPRRSGCCAESGARGRVAPMLTPSSILAPCRSATSSAVRPPPLTATCGATYHVSRL